MYEYYDKILYNVVSSSGKKMRYFYEQISTDNFLNNFDVFSYLVEGRPMNNHLIKYEDEYLYATVMGDQDIDNGDFFYKINNSGFRNKHFTKLKKENVNVLTAGCSVTYGMALPEDYIWTTMLKNKISDITPNINLDNIGVCGIDTVQEIRNIYLYIEKYGKPDFIFMALPPIYRNPSLNNQHERVSTIQKHSWIPTLELLETNIYNRFKDMSMHIYYNILTLRGLEQYCSDLNINLRWFSWDGSSQEFYSLRNFKNIIDYKYDVKLGINKDREKYWEFARDDAHFGKKYHIQFSNLFFKEFIKNER